MNAPNAETQPHIHTAVRKETGALAGMPWVLCHCTCGAKKFDTELNWQESDEDETQPTSPAEPKASYRKIVAGEDLQKGDEYRVPNYGPWTLVEDAAFGFPAGTQWEYRRPSTPKTSAEPVPTPETDANTFVRTSLCGIRKDVVEADFARSLERRLSARDEELARLQKRIGICSTCGEEYQHDLNEPFTYCKCGTTEWAFTDVSKEPLTIQAQYQSAELARVTAERDLANSNFDALSRGSSATKLNELTVERDESRAQVQTLRAFIDKVGFYCAGTDCDAVAKQAIEILK